MSLGSSPNAPTFVYDDLPLHWQMTRQDKFALVGLLEKSKPQVAIEIGTYRGGSLQAIAQHARKVYSLDIEPKREELGPHFSNVEFLTGRSAELVPGVLDQITAGGEHLGFVLVDGDHSAKGVRADINALLRHKPTCPMYIVCHDSFNPECRRGMLTADWQSNSHVQFVEIDFVPGVFHFHQFDTAKPRSMYAGLALAKLSPEPRSGELTIYQSQKELFETVFRASRYYVPPQRPSLLRRIKRKLFN